jgi:hypothetical protein
MKSLGIGAALLSGIGALMFMGMVASAAPTPKKCMIDACLSGLHIHPPVLVFFHNRASTRSPLAPMSWTRLSERAMRE